MRELGKGEIALRRELFDGIIDELMDALGWLLVIEEEYPEVLRRTCGCLDAKDRLSRMCAVLRGRILNTRYDVADRRRSEHKVCSGEGDAHRHANSAQLGSSDLETWKRALEQDKDTDRHNTRE